jgi:hypothetical protein
MPPLGVVAMSCAGDLVSLVLQRADGPDFAVGPLGPISETTCANRPSAEQPLRAAHDLHHQHREQKSRQGDRHIIGRQHPHN